MNGKGQINAGVAPQEVDWDADTQQAINEAAQRFVDCFEGSEVMPGWQLLSSVGPIFMRAGSANLVELNDEQSRKLVELSEADPAAFDLAAYTASRYVAVGALIPADKFPPSLRLFAGEVLAGERQRPKVRGRQASDTYLRLTKYLLARFVDAKTQIPLSKNKYRERESVSACCIVAEAFTNAGRFTTSEQVHSLCYDQNYHHLREFAECMNLLNFD